MTRRHTPLMDLQREGMDGSSGGLSTSSLNLPLLAVHQLAKRFSAQQEWAVRDVSLRLNPGEILALLGPSGCGKTTTLRMIAGFETPDQGSIELRGRSVAHLPARQRNIGVVFQDFALFPHLNLLENVAFGILRLPRSQRPTEARRWLATVGMADYAERMPDELSGGQQQRVALARTLAATPDVVLLDEPFSNLDAALRESTRHEVRDLFKQAGTTAILVTHDQAEALSFADRVGVMNQGTLVQIDAPETLYHRPKTAFVAEFLGHTNLLSVTAQGQTANSPLGTLQLLQAADGPVLVSLRPEHLLLRPRREDEASNCRVLSREFRGHDTFYRVESDGYEYKVLAPFYCALQVGDNAMLKAMHPASIVVDDM